MNRKAQSEIVGFILVAFIVIILVLGSYVWGDRILSEKRDEYAAVRMKTKMLEIRDAIVEVSQDGSNSTRVLSVNIVSGKMYLDTSFIPVSCGQERRDNGILYEIATKNEVVSSESWVLSDPSENETGDLCAVGGVGSSYPGVLFAKSAGTGEQGKYLTQYLVSFRNLKDPDTGEHHIIRIGSSSIAQNTTGIGGGTHIIMIRNEGSAYDSANSRWTHDVAVIFDP